MLTTTELLAQAPHNYTDDAWLAEHAEALREQIAAALKDEQNTREAINALLFVFPRIFHREDLKHWARLLSDALKRTPVQQGEPMDGRTAYAIGDVYILVKQKVVMLPSRKRRRRVKMNPRDLFETYLALFMAQVVYHSEMFTRDKLDVLLDFARFINNSYDYHKVYQTLAFVENQEDNFDRALVYGQLSWKYWEAQSDETPPIVLERALTAYALSAAYFGKREMEPALQWLETASELFAGLDRPLQYGVIARQRGMMFISLQDYDAAIDWLQLAVKELTQIDAKFQLAMAQHYLGMAIGYAGRVEDAIRILDDALALWEQLGNPRERIHTEHTLAFFEARQGDTESAKRRLRRSLDATGRLPENRFRAYVQDLLERLLAAIEADNLDSLQKPGD